MSDLDLFIELDSLVREHPDHNALMITYKSDSTNLKMGTQTQISNLPLTMDGNQKRLVPGE